MCALDFIGHRNFQMGKVLVGARIDGAGHETTNSARTDSGTS